MFGLCDVILPFVLYPVKVGTAASPVTFLLKIQTQEERGSDRQFPV